MGFSPEKRAFFVETLGEERVRWMEEHLPALGKELEEHGVKFKQLVEDVVSFADAEAARLFGVFTGIAYNIIHSPELSTAEKLTKLRLAVTDLATRIAGAGGKTKTGPVSPAAKYITDLETRGYPETKATKTLRESGRVGSAQAADILDGRVIQG